MATVFASSVIDAPIDRVWSATRDFNGLPDWHPGFRDSTIEDGRAGDAVGAVRHFFLKDGGLLRERLLSLSDHDHAVTYTILEAPLPMRNYVSTLRLLPVTDGNRTYAEWTATFEAAESDVAGLIDALGNGVYQGGFDALKQRFAKA
jgi:hypothetical protein